MEKIINFENKTLLDELWKNRTDEERNNQLISANGESLTYGEFLIKLNDISNKLLKMGVEKGDPIFLMASPSIEFYLLVTAIWNIGATLILTNAPYSKKQYDLLFQKVKPKMLIYMKRFRNILSHFEIFKQIPKKCELSALCEGIGQEMELPRGKIDPEQCALIFYTNNKEGDFNSFELKKLTHKNIYQLSCFCQDVFQLSPNATFISEFPFLFFACIGKRSHYLQAPFNSFSNFKNSYVDAKEFLKEIEGSDLVDEIYISARTMQLLIAYCREHKKTISNFKIIFVSGIFLSIKPLMEMRSFFKGDLFFVIENDLHMPLSIRSYEEMKSSFQEKSSLGHGVPIGKIFDFWSPQIIQRNQHTFVTYQTQYQRDHIGPGLEAIFEYENSLEYVVKLVEDEYYFCGYVGDEVYEDEKIIYPYQVIAVLEKLADLEKVAYIQYQYSSLVKTSALIVVLSEKGRSRHWTKVLHEISIKLKSITVSPYHIVKKNEIPSIGNDEYRYDFKKLRADLFADIKFHLQIKDDLFMMIKSTFNRNKLLGVIFFYSVLYSLFLNRFICHPIPSIYQGIIKTEILKLKFWNLSICFFLLNLSFYFFYKKRGSFNFKKGHFYLNNNFDRRDKVIGLMILSSLLFLGFWGEINLVLILIGLILFQFFMVIFACKLESKKIFWGKFIAVFTVFSVMNLFLMDSFFYKLKGTNFLGIQSLFGKMIILGHGTISLFLIYLSLLELPQVFKDKNNQDYLKLFSYSALLSLCFSLLFSLLIFNNFNLKLSGFLISIFIFLVMLMGLGTLIGNQLINRPSSFKWIILIGMILLQINLLAFSYWPR